MVCPLCHGQRNLKQDGLLYPCPECEGRGDIHCCEGLVEQPGAEDDGEKPMNEKTFPPEED